MSGNSDSFDIWPVQVNVIAVDSKLVGVMMNQTGAPSHYPTVPIQVNPTEVVVRH